jgi:hypothetical protein
MSVPFFSHRFKARLDRYRSPSDLTAADLDLLYSEFVFLPI